MTRVWVVLAFDNWNQQVTLLTMVPIFRYKNIS